MNPPNCIVLEGQPRSNADEDIHNLDGTTEEPLGVPWFPSLSKADHNGVVRVIKHSARPGVVRIVARDDRGMEYAPVMLAVDTGKAAHFNSPDLELGNPAKGLTGSTGAGEDSWQLKLSSAWDIEVLSYIRSRDELLTPVHDLARVVDGYRVAFFNPASNERQVSRLRLINPGAPDAAVRLTGVDDAGLKSGTPMRLVVPGGMVLAAISHERCGVGETFPYRMVSGRNPTPSRNTSPRMNSGTTSNPP